MKRAAVQVLAQIRLNLSSVDQFLAIACGLGDDNPDIKEEIYSASREVRSSALLIDHLRNLFNHQQSVEARREILSELLMGNDSTSNYGQQFQSSSLKESNVSLQERQQQQDIDIDIAIEENPRNRFEERNRRHHHLQQQQPQPQPQPQHLQDNTSSLLFTYTNQLTLIRASKCLVANVAKILYLTDSILARSGHSLERDDCFEDEEREQQQRQEQKQKQKYFSTTCNEQDHQLQLQLQLQHQQQLLNSGQQQQQQQQQHSSHFAISDRLDNVANYSQLLRSFSELSGELVDLGRCIMLSQQPFHRPQTFYRDPFPCYDNNSANNSFLINGRNSVREPREERKGGEEHLAGEGEEEEEVKGNELFSGYQQTSQPLDRRELSFCLPPQLPCRLPLSKQENALSSSGRHFRGTRIAPDRFDNGEVGGNTSTSMSTNNNDDDDGKSNNNNSAQVASSANGARHHLFQAHLTYPTPLTSSSSTYRRPISQVPPHYRSLSTIEKLQFENIDNFERQLEDLATSSQVDQQHAKILNSLLAGQEIIGQLGESSGSGGKVETKRLQQTITSVLSDCVAEEGEEAELFGGGGEDLTSSAAMPQDQRQLLHNNHNQHQQHHKLFSHSPNNLRGYLLLQEAPPSAQTMWSNRKPSSSIIIPSLDYSLKLEVQIQDIQTLFQVNRLIIDRSILLLLSASKCCLWQGNESLLGFSARRSILVQIRASISIIMALVKYSVFNGGDSVLSMYEREPLNSNRHNHGTMMKTEGIVPLNLSTDSETQGFQPASTLGALNSQNLKNTNNNSSGNSRSMINCIQGSNFGSNPVPITGRDNQFGHHYFACQSPYRHSTPKLTSKTTFLSNGYNVPPSEHYLNQGEFDASVIFLSTHQRQYRQEQGGDSCCEAANKLFEADKKKENNNNSGIGISPAAASYLKGIKSSSNSINSNSVGIGFGLGLNLGNGSSIGNNRNKFTAPARVDSQLQIQNYFLQTWNGTQSAHDAINKLQTLVAPFTRIASHRCLVEALDSIFISQHCSSQLSNKQPPQPSNPKIRASSAGVEDPSSCWRWNSNNNNNDNESNKENGFLDFQAANTGGSNSDILTSRDMMLINKRQLINSLNSTFLGETKTNLIERAHEFTDCPYTKHEHRETIVLLLHCIKISLNKFVKLLYKLRRKTTLVSDIHLNQLRNLASQLDDTCAELKYELQGVVIEQSDELDRCNVELDLIKQIKHHCLSGDIGKVGRICGQFQEQSEQLVEICKMLNQISPTHKMKITTKALAIWFELNMSQLLSIVHCLAQNPRSKVAKDCTWAYIQVWCSFYDDFCQLARQIAYLAHSQYDSNRFERVASLCHQVLLRRRLSEQTNVTGQQHCHRQVGSGSGELEFCGQMCLESGQVNIAGISPLANGRESLCEQRGSIGNQQHQVGSIEQRKQQQQQKVEDRIFAGNTHSQTRSLSQSRANNADVMLDNARSSSILQPTNRLVQEQQQQRHTTDQFINHANSVQSLNMVDTFSDTTGSPRSLDHYHGFGNNYHSHNRTSRASALRPPSASEDSGNFDRRQAVCSQPPPDIEYRRQHLQQHQHQQFQHQHHQLQQQQILQRDLSYEYNMQRDSVAREQDALYKSGHQAPVVHRDQWIPVREEMAIQPPAAPARRPVTTIVESPQLVGRKSERKQQQHLQFASDPSAVEYRSRAKSRDIPGFPHKAPTALKTTTSMATAAAACSNPLPSSATVATNIPAKQAIIDPVDSDQDPDQDQDQEQMIGKDTDQHSSATEQDKWSDSDADAIVRGAKEIAQMALSMYQFTRGEGELNTTQDLFTQAELFAEEANELYKEVRCFSYKVPAGDLKKELLAELGTIPALVQQMQFTVKNPTVGKPATFAKVDSVIRETRSLMEAVNRVVTATLSCRQHYNMAIASMRKRTRTLSPSYRNDKGFEFESNHLSNRQSGGISGRHGPGAGSMGSEPDIFQYGRGPSRRAVARSNTASSKTRVSFLLF